MFTCEDFGIRTAMKVNADFRFLLENILRGDAKAICLEGDMEYPRNFFHPPAVCAAAY